jgi:Na+/melibiose symporter-like transporter
VAGAAFVAWERRVRHPMLHMGLFRNPRFSVGVIAITLAFFALFGTIFVNTQYLQFVHGYSALEAGLAITPVAFGMLIGAANSHRLVARFGTAKVVGFGMAVLSAALATYVFWTESTPYPVIGVTIVVMAFGIANAMAPATEAVMGAVPVAKAGVGSAMNDTTRQVGGAFGVAILGSVVNAMYSSRMTAPPGAPAEIAGLVKDSVGGAIAVAQRLGGPEGTALANMARQAFLDAMDAAMIVAAAVALAGAVVAWRFMPARARPEPKPVRAAGPIARAVPGIATEPDGEREG